MDGEISTMLTLIKGSRSSVSISDRANFKARKVTRDKEGHYITIKGQFSKKT